MTPPVRFAVVGAGYRAEYFWTLAAPLEQLDCVGVVVRTPRRLSVPTFSSVDECLATRPDFVVTSVPASVTPTMITAAVQADVPVLAETPPATDLAHLKSLWERVGDSGLVQVAEQYLLLPSHAARLAVVRSGAIGSPVQAHISSTQYYHAVSLIRGLLGVGREQVRVRASARVAPLVNPLTRQRWTHDVEPHPTRNVLATIDFAGGRSGLYDFTDNQTRNPLRGRRTLVRGSHGELSNDRVVRAIGAETIVTTDLVRRQTGHDLDLDGYDTDHIAFGGDVVYRNPVFGHRWNDDEVAIATLLLRMADWVRGEGPEPYPLADGCYDHQVGLAIDRAVDTGAEINLDPSPWLEGAATG